MTEQQMLLSAICAEGTVIVAMAGYVMHLTAKNNKQNSAHIRMVVEAAMKMTAALEANTKTIDMMARTNENTHRGRL